MKNFIKIMISLFLLLSVVEVAISKQIQMKTHVLGSGSRVGQSTNFKLTNTIGEPATGVDTLGNVDGRFGFWYTLHGSSQVNGAISGVKFNDLNGNSIKDDGEPGLLNWKITISGASSETTYTDVNGNYIFNSLATGTYTVSEEQQAGWIQTFPTTPGTYIVNLSAGQNETYKDFGNFELPSIRPVSPGTTYLPSTSFCIEVSVGDPIEVSNLFGISFKLKSNQTWCKYVDDTAVPGNFLGTPILPFFRMVDTQTVDMVVTRTSPPGINGSGIVAKAQFIANDTGKVIFSLLNITANDANGNDIPFNPFSLLITVNEPSVITTTVTVSKDWNMISVPIKVVNNYKDTLFPGATSDAFKYDTQYIIEDSLLNGIGYWLKFSSSQNINIIGIPIEVETIVVKDGWNLIGSVSEPITASSITSDPPGIRTSDFFGYTSSYVTSDTIYPGSGYWVKVDTAGRLILSANSSTSLLAKDRIKIVASSELPPPPPDESSSTLMGLPKEFALHQNHPNPFNPTTIFKYGIPVESRVTLRVYNLLGQVIATLTDKIEDVGYKSVEWNASSIASGIYFYRLEATSVSDPSKTFTQVKKMLLLR